MKMMTVNLFLLTRFRFDQMPKRIYTAAEIIKIREYLGYGLTSVKVAEKMSTELGKKMTVNQIKYAKKRLQVEGLLPSKSTEVKWKDLLNRHPQRVMAVKKDPVQSHNALRAASYHRDDALRAASYPRAEPSHAEPSNA